MRAVLRTIFLAVLFAIGAQAAPQYSLVIAITNAPSTNAQTLTVNSSQRIFTNSPPSGSALFIQTNATITGTATNLYNHFADHPITGLTLFWNDTNSIRFEGIANLTISGTIVSNLGTMTFSTNQLTTRYAVSIPWSALAFDTNRTNQASELIDGLGRYSTNAIPTNSVVNSNYLTRGASPQQYMASPVQFGGIVRIASAGQATNLNLVNATNSGVIGAVTNGIWAYGVFLSPKLTNGANYGNAFSSPGPGTGSEQFGTGAQALTNFGTAIGNGAVAGYGSFAGGYLASAAQSNSVALGGGAEVTQMDGIALGQNTSVDGYRGNAFGYHSVVDTGHQLSTAIGANTTTTASNQVRLGSSTATVSIPGVLAIEGTQTNTTWRGTNVLNGRLDFKPSANTGLANGYNSGVVLGTNVYLRLSGNSAAVTNAGFVAEMDGSYHVLQFDNPTSNLTILNSSGLEATVANRILTGTGGDLNLTNNPVIITTIYDAAASRWRLISWTR